MKTGQEEACPREGLLLSWAAADGQTHGRRGRCWCGEAGEAFLLQTPLLVGTGGTRAQDQPHIPWRMRRGNPATEEVRRKGGRGFMWNVQCSLTE